MEIRTDGPVRTCVGCRQRATKRELLRVTLVAGEVVPDLQGSAPGRGAHLHPTAACFALAERRRAFARALRAPAGTALDLARVRERFAAQQQDPDDPVKPQEWSTSS